MPGQWLRRSGLAVVVGADDADDVDDDDDDDDEKAGTDLYGARSGAIALEDPGVCQGSSSTLNRGPGHSVAAHS
jgi:hypothetical protein